MDLQSSGTPLQPKPFPESTYMKVISFLKRTRKRRHSAKRSNETTQENTNLGQSRSGEVDTFHLEDFHYSHPGTARTESHDIGGLHYSHPGGASAAPAATMATAAGPVSITALVSIAEPVSVVELVSTTIVIESNPLTPYMEVLSSPNDAILSTSTPFTEPTASERTLTPIPDPSICTRDPSEPSPFLSLPYEIRQMIYRSALQPLILRARTSCPETQYLDPELKLQIRWRGKQAYTVLSRLNKQVHDEVAEMVWGPDGFILYMTEPRLTRPRSTAYVTDGLMKRIRFVVVAASRMTEFLYYQTQFLSLQEIYVVAFECPPEGQTYCSPDTTNSRTNFLQAQENWEKAVLDSRGYQKTSWPYSLEALCNVKRSCNVDIFISFRRVGSLREKTTKSKIQAVIDKTQGIVHLVADVEGKGIWQSNFSGGSRLKSIDDW